MFVRFKPPVVKEPNLSLSHSPQPLTRSQSPDQRSSMLKFYALTPRQSCRGTKSNVP
ncbi:hypothetical protein PCANC_28187 [Puccinia coronata f. sp. avenae]|uniref:Uncharacterized protein n=1 Tax=Puccinia coronata f. sp. avenae TaxID=200324 RepID=A0A2N5TIC5_9BASI|nr:hypothetical protein PCANC_28187 [Puccinia coronata f. sp. avenae]